MSEMNRDELLRRLDTLWQLHPQPLTSGFPVVGQVKETANSLTRWYVQPLVEQQNSFNAAVVQALHALAASADQHADLHAQAAMRRFERNELLIEQTRDAMQTDREVVQQIRNHLETDLREQQRTILEAQQLIDYLRQRIEADEQRIERNRYLLEQLVQHLHDLDEADTALAMRLGVPDLPTPAHPDETSA